MSALGAVLGLVVSLAAAIAGVYAASVFLGPRGVVEAGPFLSGARPQDHALSRFHVSWYAMSLVFLAFDMEMRCSPPQARSCSAWPPAPSSSSDSVRVSAS
ncbi:NADH-quinone oxidoreductase subunit A [Nonomuraea sp. K274]|uniref:NADH-quinone oxidoreductase subunit n=1 Tax=Nonomuraea cypriaca TaxID=1187855 RepID=A0A931ACV3_9ACTN|nr:NADH-quinone oxidoreductase subunit A [Nonomuraea cypriaca]MBF8187844.1 NADH-quinone oxidoreductase subunit A [Nonomuraea cypriaca]